MSIGDVRQITVSNETTFDASIYVITATGAAYFLSPQLEAGNTNIFDLNKVQGLQDGGTLHVRVVSGQGTMYNDDTLFTYTKNSKDEAIFAIEGTANAPTVAFQILQTIINGGSPPPPHVRQITFSNVTGFDASIYVVTATGAAYSLSPQLEAGNINIVFDLNTVQGLKNGDILYARVVSGQGAIKNDDKLLTYIKNSKSEAIYAIEGTANAPSVAFQILETIIHSGSPLPPHVRQITVSNDTAFDAKIYVITATGTPYFLSPQLEAGNTNIVFDLITVMGLKNGDTFHARVTSGNGTIDNSDMLLTYTKNSKNEAIYNIEGTTNAPTVAFQTLETIIHGGSLPPPHVRQITVSNGTAFDASIYVITAAGAPYVLSPQLEAGNINIVFDLNTVKGLKNGDTFHARVDSRQGGIGNDDMLLTYTKNSKSEAIYNIEGTANAPSIAFQILETIIHSGSPPPPRARQITVSNVTAFDASIYVITATGAAYFLHPQLASGTTNIPFNLTMVTGLKNGDTFHVRVVSYQGAVYDDATLLTCTKNSNNAAIYAIAGTANAPTIALIRSEPLNPGSRV
ncbi:hypothetical protein C8J56DRAFT_1030380 [Mycena floridula]|nr:hypothetical protein C8J56DRAFT_1030380 [Mycena floridula]